MNHQQANARRLIDAGVDVVVGHHPHVLHPVEVYRGGVIFYSLGNFFFDQKHTLQRHGMLAHVTWTNTGPNKRPALSAVELHGIIRPYDLGPIQRADQQNRRQILGRIKGTSAKGHRTRFRWAGTAGILKWQSTTPGSDAGRRHDRTTAFEQPRFSQRPKVNRSLIPNSISRRRLTRHVMRWVKS